MTTATILIVDDEANIRSSLGKILSQEGYQVITVASGEAALKQVSAHAFDLALIDLRLPDMGGIEILTALREQSPATVNIILTAHGSLDTAIKALRHGAHDYLLKPCDPTELLASVRQGLQQRQAGAEQQELLHKLDHLSHSLADIKATIAGSSDPLDKNMIELREKRFLEYNGLIVDVLEHVVTVNGHRLDLTPIQFEIVTYLMRQIPRVISHQELLEKVLGYEGEPWEGSDVMRQHIHRIRRKIEEKTGRSDLIRNTRGVGYSIGAQQEA